MSKDQFLNGFNFSKNPDFVLHFISHNNPQGVLANLQANNLVPTGQEADPNLLYNILLSFLQTGRISQLRNIVRVPLNTEDPATINPAILEALTDLKSNTQIAL